MSHHTTAGVVLAAGRSRRMGASKPLLDLDGRTFIRAAVEALRGGGCSPIIAVVADPATDAEAQAAGADVAHAPSGAEQVDSLRAGIDRLPAHTDAALVLPVDHPLIRASTVRALVDAAASHPDAVIRPVHGGRPGHPTLFPRSVWPALADPTLPNGARSVVESPDTRTVDLAVDDPGVVADIDTPADYRRHVAGAP